MTRRLQSNMHEECLPALSGEGPPVVIAALTETAEAIWRACVDAGVQVAAFTDGKEEKTRMPYCGLEVIQRAHLPERFPQARVLLATPDFADAVAQFRALGYTEIFSAASLLRGFDWERWALGESAKRFLRTRAAVYLLGHDHYFDLDLIFLRSVDVVITERCSLKCRDCSNLMQYYDHPRHADADQVSASVDRLCRAVHAIGEFRVIGGEPLMNPHWATISSDLLKRTPDARLVVYTNGTIVPEDGILAGIQGREIVFSITDYGEASGKCNALAEKLRAFGIGYKRIVPAGWTDCGSIVQHGRAGKEQADVFTRCCVKNLWTILHGKLYRCPFSANLDALRAIPDARKDFIDLLADVPLQELKADIRRLASVPFLNSCDYCNGRDYDAPIAFPAAIQMKNPLPYTRYENLT